VSIVHPYGVKHGGCIVRDHGFLQVSAGIKDPQNFQENMATIHAVMKQRRADYAKAMFVRPASLKFPGAPELKPASPNLPIESPRQVPPQKINVGSPETARMLTPGGSKAVPLPMEQFEDIPVDQKC
jgi:hypothetical protein